MLHSEEVPILHCRDVVHLTRDPIKPTDEETTEEKNFLERSTVPYSSTETGIKYPNPGLRIRKPFWIQK
jgi:hypothetical protein